MKKTLKVMSILLLMMLSFSTTVFAADKVEVQLQYIKLENVEKDLTSKIVKEPYTKEAGMDKSVQFVFEKDPAACPVPVPSTPSTPGDKPKVDTSATNVEVYIYTAAIALGVIVLVASKNKKAKVMIVMVSLLATGVLSGNALLANSVFEKVETRTYVVGEAVEFDANAIDCYKYVGYISEANQGNVVVKYVDTEGNELLPQEEVVVANVGEAYDTTAHQKAVIEQDNKKYMHLRTEGNETGKISLGTTTVVYVYQGVGNVVVKYVDTDGNELLPSVEAYKDAVVDSDYTTSGLKKDKFELNGNRYQYKETQGVEDGKITFGTQEVVYVYQRVGDIIVRYFNHRKEKIREDFTYKTDVAFGETYDVKSTDKNIPEQIEIPGIAPYDLYVPVPEEMKQKLIKRVEYFKEADPTSILVQTHGERLLEAMRDPRYWENVLFTEFYTNAGFRGEHPIFVYRNDAAKAYESYAINELLFTEYSSANTVADVPSVEDFIKWKHLIFNGNYSFSDRRASAGATGYGCEFEPTSSIPIMDNPSITYYRPDKIDNASGTVNENIIYIDIYYQPPIPGFDVDCSA